jgi:hypothetical protein
VDGADRGWVRIRLEGGCQGCSLAEVTVRQGIEPLLRARLLAMTGLTDVHRPRGRHRAVLLSGETMIHPGTSAVLGGSAAAGPRVLLLVPARTYRAADFLLAASRMGLDLVIASDGALPVGGRPVIPSTQATRTPAPAASWPAAAQWPPWLPWTPRCWC